MTQSDAINSSAMHGTPAFMHGNPALFLEFHDLDHHCKILTRSVSEGRLFVANLCSPSLTRRVTISPQPEALARDVCL
jgi:hypothetical protein